MINLKDILKDFPNDTELYSPAFGTLKFKGINFSNITYPIITDKYSFTEEGKLHPDGEVMLFPSKDVKSWDKFKNKSFLVTAKPFDKVLVRNFQHEEWGISFFGYYDNDSIATLENIRYNQVIPFNDETKNLLGTPVCCDKKYKWW